MGLRLKEITETNGTTGRNGTCANCGRSFNTYERIQKYSAVYYDDSFKCDGDDCCSRGCAMAWYRNLEKKRAAESAAIDAKREEKYAEWAAEWEAKREAERKAKEERERIQQEKEDKIYRDWFNARNAFWNEANAQIYNMNQNKYKINPDKRQKIINGYLEKMKCKCCGKISPELIALQYYEYPHSFSSSIRYAKKDTEKTVSFKLSDQDNVNDFINNKEINFKNFSEKQLQFLGIAKVEDFSAYEKDILYYNYADIEKEYSEYETYFSRQENFKGTFYYHITEHRKTKINHEKAKQSDYLAITDYNYTDSNTKFSPEKYVNILIPNQKKIDDYVLNNIDPVYSYCCSAECKQKLIESSGAEKKKNELFEKNIKSINEKIAKFLKAKRKKFIIGAAAVAGWFLLLGILIGMSKDSFDYWDKTQYANNSYPCYEFATFANKDGVFYHTENKKYAISLAYVENPIEVPDEVTEDTYKDYIQVLEKQMNYGDSQENDEKFERKKLKKLLGKTQWLDDFPTGERLVFCIDVAELGKKSIKHKYAFVRIRLDDWGKIESVSNATNVYRYYTAVYNK